MNKAKYINMSSLSEPELKMYNQKLSTRRGAKEAAVEYSKLSRTTYFHVMRGGAAKKATIKAVVNANLKVIKNFIDTQAK